MPTQTIGCEHAAYEFLRMLNGWGRGILAGDARKGDIVQIKRKLDFRVKDPTTGAWSMLPKKVDITESVLMSHEAIGDAVLPMDWLSLSIDEFSDKVIRAIVDRVGIKIRQEFPNPNATLVMGVPMAPDFPPGVQGVSFTACDSGAGIAVMVSKTIGSGTPKEINFRFHIVFGFTGSAIKIADIFKSPNEKEIAALGAERKRLMELLATRATRKGDWIPPSKDDLTGWHRRIKMPPRFVP